MINKKYKHLAAAFLITLLTTTTVHAGLISLLGKAGKAVNKADVDIPVSKIELPENIGDVAPASIKPNSSGHWEIKLDNGSAVSFDELLKSNVGNKKKPVLVLNVADIPADLSMFKNIPESLPVYINAKNKQVFELQRDAGVALKYKNVRLPVQNAKQLKDGLWHLQRPALSGTVRLFQFDKDINKRVQETLYASKAVVEKVGGNALLDSISSLKRQTVVISAPVKNGKLPGASIKQLQQAAAENDINLIIIDSDKPAKLLKKFAKETNTGNSINALYDTTGDFLNKFRDHNNSSALELRLSNTGNSQSVVQLKSAQTNTVSPILESNLIDASHIPLHLLSKAVTVYRPDQERSKELDQRIVPWLHSDIQYYLIVSTVMGLIAISTSWTLWKKIWLLRKRKQYSNILIFAILWLLHRLLFITIFITILGLPSFLYAVVMVIVKTINFLVIRPVRWIVGLVSN